MKMCKWCEIREAAKGRPVCHSCGRQKHRKPHCPTCEGPTFGDDRFCERCSPRRPLQQPSDAEIAVTLIDPRGREREVYRKVGQHIPCTKSDFNRGHLDQKYIVLDVSLNAWLRAKEVS